VSGSSSREFLEQPELGTQLHWSARRRFPSKSGNFFHKKTQHRLSCIHSIFDDVAPCILPLPASTIINDKFSSLRLKSIIIFAPSISPNQKQATNVLNLALTTWVLLLRKDILE
jgi:hypothetical protein